MLLLNAIFMTILMTLLLPAIFIIMLWRSSYKSKLQWLLDSAATVVLISWLTQALNWSWIGYYIRYFWPILLLFALYVSWKKMRNEPFITAYKKGEKFSIFIYIVLIVVFGYYNVGAIKSYTVQEASLELTFPLRDGTYYVGQGGNHPMMNYHQIAPSQKFALDILKINAFGVRAKGLFPKDLEKYYIFEDDLVSPCTGEVIEAENDFVDHIPPETDTEHVTGNYVKLLCDHHDAYVYIAHMKQGSVVVSEGKRVEEGQLIGKVGNSGNTTEPHLHIHAELDGEGVPITFNGKFLVRNSLMR